ncbi:hypothetical protein V2J23_12300 [Geobacillus thermoleovorans]|uniref:hypothetical protein n=1 Tax=Geobacillus thermoleovorans TaxID=33941 RepID=UPI00345C150E
MAVALGGVRLVRVFFAFEAGSVRRSIEEPVKRLGQLLPWAVESGAFSHGSVCFNAVNRLEHSLSLSPTPVVSYA